MVGRRPPPGRPPAARGRAPDLRRRRRGRIPVQELTGAAPPTGTWPVTSDGGAGVTGRYVRVIGGELRGRRWPPSAIGAADLGPGAGGHLRHPLQPGRCRRGSGGRPLRRVRGPGHRGAVPGRGVGHLRGPGPRCLDAIRGTWPVGLADAEREGDATVVRADVDDWVATTAPLRRGPVRPPVRLRRLGRLVARLPADLAVLESGAEITAPDGWVVIKTRRYGGTIVTVARPERSGSIQKGAS